MGVGIRACVGAAGATYPSLPWPLPWPLPLLLLGVTAGLLVPVVARVSALERRRCSAPLGCGVFSGHLPLSNIFRRRRFAAAAVDLNLRSLCSLRTSLVRGWSAKTSRTRYASVSLVRSAPGSAELRTSCCCCCCCWPTSTLLSSLLSAMLSFLFKLSKKRWSSCGFSAGALLPYDAVQTLTFQSSTATEQSSREQGWFSFHAVAAFLADCCVGNLN